MPSYRTLHADALELNPQPQTMRSSSMSISSDVVSQSTRSTANSALPQASPPPAYIAAAEASQLISTEVEDAVDVAQPALALLNSFLDQILYNILSTAQSAALSCLRDAVPVVLKPRLGKAAIEAADEELKEYLDEGDSDTLHKGASHFESNRAFDLELAWKLARLRCMVYTRLGDMEEEDEEEYIEEEQLQEGSGKYSHATSRASAVKAAGAIFLTSILEFLGEQALLYAVQNTQRRSHAPKLQEAPSLSSNGSLSVPSHQKMVLDEVDMFHVGRESPLSRLWRSWRRQMRSPVENQSRPWSPASAGVTNGSSPIVAQKDSILAAPATVTDEADAQNSSTKGMLRLRPAHQIALPCSNNDVNEIEVPGLAREILDDDDSRPLVPIPVPERKKGRSSSMTLNKSEPTTPPMSELPDNTVSSNHKYTSRPTLSHSRSKSHPGPEQTSFTSMRNAWVYDPGDRASRVEKTFAKPEENGAHDGSVIVAASALGIGAVASSAMSRQAADLEANPNRTVADEMLGTTRKVPPPSDAVTGSSITSAGDFDNLHIPMSKPQELSTITTAELSDPEDLALSSGDEDTNIAENKRNSLVTPLQTHPTPEEPTVVDPTHSNTAQNASLRTLGTTPVGEASRDSKAAAGQEITPKKSAEGHLKRELDPLNVGAKPHTAESTTNGVLNEDCSPHDHVALPIVPSLLNENMADNGGNIDGTALSADQDKISGSPTSRPSTASTAIHNSATRSVPPRTSSDRSRAQHTPSDSKSSEYSQHSKSSSSSSRLLGFTRDQEGHPQPSTSRYEKVTGPGVAALSQRSGSAATARGSRPGTSASKREAIRIRTSSEDERLMDHAEAKKKSLDILIRGDETLHYTLTPVSARAENFPIPPGGSLFQAKKVTDSTRSSAARDERATSHQSTTSSGSMGVNGLRSHPPNNVSGSPSVSGASNGTYAATKTGTASAPTSPARTRSFAEPRDARVDRNTTRDLADYARSTGPESVEQLPKALSSRPGTSATTSTFPSMPGSVKAGRAAVVLNGRPSTVSTNTAGSGSQSANRPKFQAREPTVSRQPGTNDLIDFIREGPPSSVGDINGNTGDENARSSVASTQTSSVAVKSVQSSMSSRTALLGSANRPQSNQVNGAGLGYAAGPRQAAAARQGATLARKQRRVRDPYAIDDSDDDLNDQQPTPTATTQDESLIDFLRNTAPPPGMSPTSTLAAPAAATATTGVVVRRVPSVQGIKDRILLTASRTSLNRRNSAAKSGPETREEDPPQYTRGNAAPRETSPHLVQKGKRIDSYRPTQVTHAAHVDRERRPRTALQARPARSRGQTGTADLADYLKNSGPPDVARARRSSQVREEAGFLRFFSRRKAVK